MILTSDMKDEVYISLVTKNENDLVNSNNIMMKG